MTLPSGSTHVALPFVSKHGFSGGTTSSLIYALIHGGMSRCRFAFYGDYSVVHARNAAASDAIRDGAEWLWFIDSDMDFPVNTLERLKALDADIACADMWSRSIPSFRTVMRYGKPEKGKRKLVALGDDLAGVQPIDCCGMACTLIKVELLRKFAKKKVVPFAMSAHGEDAHFCILAGQKFRAKMRTDLAVVAGHYGTCRIAGQDWARDARNQPGAVADPEMLKRMGARNIDESLRERNVV